jgi:hypothetical protein
VEASGDGMIDDEQAAAVEEKIWNSLDYDTRLAVAGHMIRKVVEIGTEGGSFRHFIYGVLGFSMDAYVPLYMAGGMTITNEFDLQKIEDIKKIAEENKYEKLKSVLGLCDEPDCFKEASTGWPSEDNVYRHTCSAHFKKKNDETE